ncbi:MAG: Hsp20/alpha crystallin family protein [Saprospiraceae bacterium]|nr:Hsp20/alpha crystallin family protein [Saprospiraceae bacterium]
MTTKMEIPKELLAQIDFANTVNGGMVEFKAHAWKQETSYRLTIDAPSVNPENIHIEAANQRFVVYYFVSVLGGEQMLPYFLVNLPLAPEVDVKRISARFEHGKIHITAPFNDWAKGERREIDMEF